MITNELKSYLAGQLKARIDTAQIGFGGNSTSPSQNTLDVPSGFSTTIVKSDSDENVIEVKVSIAGSLLTGSVTREMGLFDSSNNLLSRINFEGVGPFASNETLEIFLLIEVD
tara:strand:- start:2223 stop:2561 length:339 start_codon:yes stop_codon:yes gene_type:complete